MGIMKDSGVIALVTRLKNWFALKAEAVFSVNETMPVNGDVHIEKVDYSENLWTDKTQQIDESFLRRTTAGSGSVSDGNAWALRIFGNMVHNGFTPESLTLTVIPIPRTAPAAITAVLDTETYLSEVTEAGTTTFAYTTEWSLNPATYGITVSNTPISGDVITVVWDGENDPVMTVTAETRTAPDPITATIDRDTFVAYVSQSGTIDLYYTTAWSADPALYGVTVTGDPVSGDQIEIVYVKEVRGTIVTANPTRLVATGWNLYEPLEGYARVINYSEAYGYKIGGTYTALAWSATLSGEQTTITPDENGLFRVPGTGYLFVTGGNDTDTYVMTTWSDMTAGYSSKYEFSLYSESAVSLTTIMTNFPKGLCKLGDVYDEIDFGHSQVISRIGWLAYSAENLATVIAGGTPYEYDETGIYYVKAQATTTAISQSNAYTVCEYGMEFFDGSDLPLYTEILYGQNLKDKLTRLNATAIPRTDSNSQTVEAKLALLDADSTSHSAAIANTQSGIAYIVGNTNTTGSTLSAGQFVFVKGHSSIAEGLRKVTASISANGSITTSNTTAVSGGGLNELNSNIDQLNRYYTSTPTAVTSRITHLTGGYKKIGSAVIFNVTFQAVADAANSPQIYTISDSLVPRFDTAFSCIDITNGIATAIGGSVPCGIATAGRIYIQKIENNHIYAMTGVYVTAGTL